MSCVDAGRLAVGAFVLAAVVYAALPVSRMPLRGDPANWVYFAQVLARGGAPYRDVVNIKTPLSAYLGAAAIHAGRLLGADELFAVRVAFLGLAALVVALTGVVAITFLGDLRVGIFASLAVLSADRFAEWNAAGVEPKTPMILFGLAALWAIRRDRPFAAGFFAMLSALSWQPGLVFLGAAVLGFSGDLTAWRGTRLVRLAAGAAVPLVLFLAHLVAAGALRDFYFWTVDYNWTVYRTRHLRPLSSFLPYLWARVQEDYRQDLPFFLLALPGLAILAIREARRLVRDPSDLPEAARSQALLVAPIAYGTFCGVNFQGGRDLIPLLPFVGIFSGVAVAETLGAARWLHREHRASPTERAAWVLVCATTIAFGVADGLLLREVPWPTLEDQRVAVAELTSHLGPSDRVFVHGRCEVLVLGGLVNANPHILFDFGKDRYLDRIEPGGFDGWFRRLRAEAPKIVVLSQMGNVDERARFVRWLQRDYEVRQTRVFRYFLRKDSSGAPQA